MKRRRMARFVESVLSGRRPKAFRADPQEAAMIRTALTLKAAGAEPDGPSEEFTSSLFDQLAASQPGAGDAVVRPIRRPRRAAWLPAAAAAALVLVAGTAAATEAVDHRSSPAAVGRHQQVRQVREVALLDPSHHNAGTINLLQGTPSWVFMNVHSGSYSGPVSCQLVAANGTVLMDGAFEMSGGSGEWARTIPSITDQVTSARVVTPAGITLASAAFKAA